MDSLTEGKKIIEINGVKLEVDLRQCRVIDNYRVGDKVKCLVKRYSDYESCPGVIIGFDNFTVRPTILIAYLTTPHNPELSFHSLNADSKEFEIVKANENDIPFSKDQVLIKMDKEIERKKHEMDDLTQKKENFLRWFGQYFEGSK